MTLPRVTQLSSNKVGFECLTLALGSYGTPDVIWAVLWVPMPEIRVVQKFPQSWWQRQDVSEDTFAPETSTFNDYAVLPCPVTPQLIFPPSFFTGLAPPGLSSAL